MKKQLKYMSFYLIKWLFISLIIGSLMGCLSAFFLTSLHLVTKIREDFPWLLFGLPISGAVFAFLYLYYGKNAGRGNNLIIEQANGAQEDIPLRLIPLTLFGTITTHLFGGSVGREGTAVQMGGALADAVGRVFNLTAIDREIMIISGISAGFSSVFGTPLAGTIFALEVLVLGKLRSEGIFPSFFAAFFANFVTERLGITHVHYDLGEIPEWTLILFVKLVVAGICFGLLGWIFSRSIVVVKKMYHNQVSSPVWRTFFGGCVFVLTVLLFHGERYLGLSLPLLTDAFDGNAHLFDFLGKLVYTVLSLGAGYQGGEVTPLFEIGATAGSTLAQLFHLSIPFLAGLGFIGVFSGATNTPIACFVMSVELFGSEAAMFFFMISVISYLCSGNTSIYASQQMGSKKNTDE